MADIQTKVDNFKKMDWDKKIKWLIDFYQAMIKKTTEQEYTDKFQDTIEKLEAYDENNENNDTIVDLFEKILEAEKKSLDQKKAQEADTLNKSLDKIQKIKQQEQEENKDNADDFLDNQLSDLGL